MLLQDLKKQGVINPPTFLPDNTVYLAVIGSDSYGVSSGSSDHDIFGICIPPKTDVFPHLRGEIEGFGTQKQRFNSWEQHRVKRKDNEKVYDFSVYNIVNYFDLLMKNNPNIIDSIFVPNRCVLHSTAVGNLIRDNRRDFLHKGAFFKFKGYAYSQLHKISQKSNTKNEKRQKDIEKFGFDLKFSYHLVRLLNECEQILVEGDLDIERSREQLKSIRRGEWSFEQIQEYFNKKELFLEEQYSKSKLRNVPDEEKIKQLLLKCLEHHYGSLSDAIKLDVDVEQVLSEFQTVIDRFRK